MTLIPYAPGHEQAWDQFVPRSAQGTILQTRRFLSYHGERFEDASLLFADEKGRIRSVMAAAEAPDNPDLVVSHPGLTFGGLLHDPGCRPDEIERYIVDLLDYYRSQGFKRLLYKSVPCHVRRVGVAIDDYALWRAGGRLIRRDLWNVLSLDQKRKPSKGHKWSLTRARKLGINVKPADPDRYEHFHSILTANLDARYAVRPVHTVDQLSFIESLFPEKVQLWTAESSDAKLVAGVWLFRYTEHVWHTQYIASDQHGRDTFALNLLIENIIENASAAGAKCLSFGASTQDAGQTVNGGLFGFKSGFGAGSAVHDFIEIDLDA